MGGFSTVGGLTAKNVWQYPTRELTQVKYSFWSAIIAQTAGSASVPGLVGANVYIRPPAGETWLVWIDAVLADTTAGSLLIYHQYDGTTTYEHTAFRTGGVYGDVEPHLSVMKVLSNSLYACLYAYNASSTSKNLFYGYSGFKLSKPLYTTKSLSESRYKLLKRPPSKPLPPLLKPLEKYAYDILNIDPLRRGEYELGIVLEEDTILAVDPDTGYPVELFSAYVKADVLADFIMKFKKGEADPETTGYRKYLNKWKEERIDLGV